MRNLRYPLAALYVFLVGLPIYIFFSTRWSSLAGLDLKSLALILFPVFGLLAFTLVSMQIAIGPNIKVLRKVFPNIYTFHRYQGLFAFLLAVIHPTVLVLAIGLIEAIWKRSAVSTPLQGYVLFGEAALLVMTVTVSTAFAAWKLSNFQQSWRWLHYLNYLVFIFAWVHSWFIGSDIRSTNLKYVWLFYLVAAVGSVAVRFISPGTVGRAALVPKTENQT